MVVLVAVENAVPSRNAKKLCIPPLQQLRILCSFPGKFFWLIHLIVILRVSFYPSFDPVFSAAHDFCLVKVFDRLTAKEDSVDFVFEH